MNTPYELFKQLKHVKRLLNEGKPIPYESGCTIVGLVESNINFLLEAVEDRLRKNEPIKEYKLSEEA